MIGQHKLATVKNMKADISSVSPSPEKILEFMVYKNQSV